MYIYIYITTGGGVSLRGPWLRAPRAAGTAGGTSGERKPINMYIYIYIYRERDLYNIPIYK